MIKLKRRVKSKTFQKASAILCADLHLRADTPVCRTDNFFAAMEKKIDFILALSRKHECPILCSGDFGHKPQWPNWLLEWAIKKFEKYNIIVIPGQHDLPNHRIDLWEKSGIGVLHAAGVIEVVGIFQLADGTISSCHFSPKSTEKDGFFIAPFPYDSPIKALGWGTIYQMPSIPMIAMTHMMVIENKPLWPGQNAPKGHQLLKRFSEYNLILSGDNHKPFTAEYEGRHLVNPGSMMRTTADQIEHHPRVYLWWADSNKIEAVYLPVEKGEKVISRMHIEVTKERNARIQAVVEHVKNDVELGLSYEKNMERFLEKHKEHKRVNEKIWEACAQNG